MNLKGIDIRQIHLPFFSKKKKKGIDIRQIYPFYCFYEFGPPRSKETHTHKAKKKGNKIFRVQDQRKGKFLTG